MNTDKMNMHTHSSDIRRVWTAKLLHTMQCPNPLDFKSLQVRQIRSTWIYTGIYFGELVDPWASAGCNPEFKGSIRNLYKRALLVLCYPPEIFQNNIFGKRALFCQILQRAASNYQTLISSGLFLALLHLRDLGWVL